MNSPVGDSQGNDRVENADQRVHGLIRTLQGCIGGGDLNTRIRSNYPMFAWMVEWSAGQITRSVKGEWSEGPRTERHADMTREPQSQSLGRRSCT